MEFTRQSILSKLQNNTLTKFKDTFKIPNILKNAVADIEIDEIDIDIDEKNLKSKIREYLINYLEANKSGVDIKVIKNNQKLINKLNDLSIPAIIIDKHD